jgi:hypothetical protein
MFKGTLAMPFGSWLYNSFVCNRPQLVTNIPEKRHASVYLLFICLQPLAKKKIPIAVL